MTLTLDVLEDLELRGLPEEEACFGAVRTDSGPLPLKAMAVEARITGLHYRAAITQTFVNAFSHPLEATYIFPLPHRAGVTRFRMRVGERVVDGILKERGEARREYREAIRRGHRAALAEEERPNVFTLRAGNIAAGEALSVELEMSAPLEFSQGEATFRFPLVVAPRYIPGVALGCAGGRDTDAVPDASRITPPVQLPGLPNPVHLGLRVEIDPAGLPLTSLRSSLHQVRLEEYGPGIRVVSLRPGVERLDRDFILRLGLGSSRVVTGLAAYRREGEEDATLQLTLVPPGLESCGLKPRDLVLLLDRSGSMGGWKMVAARRAAARIIDSLTPQDRFSVLVFDDRVETVPGTEALSREGWGPAEATSAARFRAVEFLSTVEARGGTELEPALSRALGSLDPSGERERAVVLITDGQVGNEHSLLQRVQQFRGIRVHTVGIDRAVNAAFLDRLASLSGGSCELVESEQRLDEVMRRIHHRVGPPVLRQVRLDLPGIRDLSPEGPIDVYPGAPVVVSGRFAGELPAAVDVVGTASGEAEYRTKVALRQSQDPVLETVWARARVLDLEHRFAVDGGRQRGAEITAFSLRWGVLCRSTAFVAVDRSQVVEGADRIRSVVQPVEMPSGWAESSDLFGSAGGDAREAGYYSLACCRTTLPAPSAPRDLFCVAEEPLEFESELCDLAPPPPPQPKAEVSALPSLRRLLAVDLDRLRKALEQVSFDQLVMALFQSADEIVDHVCRALDEPVARALRQRQALEWFPDHRVREARQILLAALGFRVL